jgi:hypothetical protein
LYSKEQTEKLFHNYEKVCSELRALLEETVLMGGNIDDRLVKEYLMHGVARRVGTIRRAVQNIFKLFPPNCENRLEKEVIDDIAINMQAHVMNVFGVFDNWAWAFILRHGLLDEVGGMLRVGIFQKNTKDYLPKVLVDYINNTLKKWHLEYLKSYRDTLAHRIPLYIPPLEYNEYEIEYLKELEKNIDKSIINNDWDAVEKLGDEKEKLGAPSFVFLHSFSERPLLLHPQVLIDSMTVIEFGKLFLENWHLKA